MLKRVSLVLVLALALTFAFSGVAYANFGPHGGYTDDTDACAGCHRAHTSFSEVTWVSENPLVTASRSALLIGTATDMSEFCNACHGDAAPGASTNVVAGVFDSGPSGAANQLPGASNGGVAVEYQTLSTFDATLNGGGFTIMPVGTVGAQNYKASTSAHDMDLALATDPMWGDGNQVPASANLTCTNCHDPHGSSNYRLLKDSVNGNTVGGYIDDNTPTPFVTSAEVNYPAVGWRKHEAGAAQMATYRPNYTQPQYAAAAIQDQGISGWCAGCHERYAVRNDHVAVGGPGTYNYGAAFTAASGGGQLPAQNFHRHPVNVSLVAGTGTSADTLVLNSAVITSTVLPLERASASGSTIAEFRAGGWTFTDYMGCLTCHRAHGSSVDMTGWAEASLDSTTPGGAGVWYPVRSTQPTVSGVNPNFTSALLRADNRGVCERCHNK